MGKEVGKFQYNTETHEIICVSINVANTRASASEWCGIGMGALGAGAVALYAAPLTFGASIGVAVCWGVVTALMCR